MSNPDFRALAKALVDALPRCSECDLPATYHGWTRRCERHAYGTSQLMYAAPLRALVAALEETSGRCGGVLADEATKSGT